MYFFISTILFLIIFFLLNKILNKNYLNENKNKDINKRQIFNIIKKIVPIIIIYCMICTPLLFLGKIKSFSSPKSYLIWEFGSIDYDMEEENDDYFIGFKDDKEINPTLLYKIGDKYETTRLVKYYDDNYICEKGDINIVKFSIITTKQTLIIIDDLGDNKINIDYSESGSLKSDTNNFYYILIEYGAPFSIIVNEEVININTDNM